MSFQNTPFFLEKWNVGDYEDAVFFLDYDLPDLAKPSNQTLNPFEPRLVYQNWATNPTWTFQKEGGTN